MCGVSNIFDILVYLRVAHQAPGGSGADCKLGLTTVKPNLLSTSETLVNWMEGTRRVHLLLFAILLHCIKVSIALPLSLVFP